MRRDLRPAAFVVLPLGTPRGDVLSRGGLTTCGLPNIISADARSTILPLRQHSACQSSTLPCGDRALRLDLKCLLSVIQGR